MEAKNKAAAVFGAMGANFNGQQHVASTLSVTVSVWFNAANLSNANPRLVANFSYRCRLIYRQDLGARRGPLVYPHIRNGADEVVAGVCRVASDVDVWAVTRRRQADPRPSGR